MMTNGSREKLLSNLTDARYDAVRQMSYIALDVVDWVSAQPLVEYFGSAVDGYKVGLELFHGDGARTLAELAARGKRVFLDMKLHDIPNTVAGALRAICRHRIEMVNIHVSGGRRMLEAARAAVEQASTDQRPLLIGVTVLTSLGDSDLADAGILATTDNLVARFSELAYQTRLDGVVASAWDVAAIRQQTSPSFEIVVPGTRPAGSHTHDQVRTLTPGAAVAAGASRLVLGRAVTGALDALVSLQSIWDEMCNAGTGRS